MRYLCSQIDSDPDRSRFGQVETGWLAARPALFRYNSANNSKRQIWQTEKNHLFDGRRKQDLHQPRKKVLNNIYLSFFYGAKIGIIGLNGSGKSTLMKIIAGIDKNFQGEVVFSPGYTVGYLEQEPKLDDAKTVREVVEEAAPRP